MAVLSSSGRARIRFFSLSLGEQQIIGAALRTGSDADPRVIEVFKDENAPDVLIDDIVREFPYRSSWVLVAVFAILLLASGWIIWRRVRPIAEVAAIAGTIGPYTLNLRLPERELPREVQTIVRGINGALERLEEAAAAQRNFLRRAAHQLRTPLTVLSARAESLDDSDVGRQLRADVREMARIISQLLQLNEVEGLPEQRDSVADLAAVGEAVRDELGPRAAQRDVRIKFEQPSGPVLVSGDPNVLEIAVGNLVENALQHSPPGATVGIRVASQREIEVVDAGQGVAEEERDKIFEPFWSGDSQAARAGLGLTIVSRIAERYGATVDVRAAPSGGAAFVLRFAPPSIDVDQSDAATAARWIPASLAHRRRRRA